MKKIIALILFGPALTFGQKNNSVKFIELNIGAATIGSHDPNDAISPGMSVLFGQTKEFSEKGIFEYQVGLAAPSFVTGKLAVGIGNLHKNIALAIRPWPLTVGPQAKIGRFSLSFELGTADDVSFEAGFIATVGYRWTIGSKK